MPDVVRNFLQNDLLTSCVQHHGSNGTAPVVEPKRTFTLKRGNKVNTFVLEDQNGDIIDTSSLESHKGKLLMVLKGKDHNPRQLFKVNCDEMPKLLRNYRIHVREEDMPTILLKKSLKEYATSLTKSSWRDSQNTVVSIYIDHGLGIMKSFVHLFWKTQMETF